MRVVLDTNTIVSGVLTPSGPPGRVLAALRERRFMLVTSEPMLDELLEVLSRARLARRYGIEKDAILELVDLLRDCGEVVELKGDIVLCRDPDDNMFLDAAVTGRADAIVTRDEDLVRDLDVIHQLEERGVRILTVRRFLALLNAEDDHS
jgi:putative PIN family toxin of toxin-antitoxin system